MKQDAFLVAERPLACHSGALTGGATPDAPDPAAELAEAAARLRLAIAGEIAALLGSTDHQVALSAVQTISAASLHKKVGKGHTHCLIGDTGRGQFVVSMPMLHALALTDQAFGGTGEIDGPAPDTLPAAAALTLTRLGDALGRAFAAVFACQPQVFTRREDVLRKLVPAGEAQPLQTLCLTVSVPEGAGWELLLALRESEAESLLRFGKGGGNKAVVARDRRHPGAAPFAEIPLELHVPLAEIPMPVSRISTLQPGDLIPLPRRSRATLKLAHRSLAEGEIGSADGALALRLTQINWNRRTTDNG